MTELCIAQHDLMDLRSRLLGSGAEACAILFATHMLRRDGLNRLLVREAMFPGADDYTRRGVDHAELKPQIVAAVSKKARDADCSLVFVHSHPGEARPQFSSVDDLGERHLARFLIRRTPGQMHAALVLSRGGLRARKLGTAEEIRLVAYGDYRDVLSEPNATEDPISEVFDRQIRAFGRQGQESIARLTVGIVGLGGTGSVVAQQLAHLGVRKFILIDPDVIEQTNLNRVVNATPSDLGAEKIRIAGRYIQSVTPNASITAIRGNAVRANVARQLREADILFACTDSHGSRAVIQQVAYQYFVPCIDLGTTIPVAEGKVTGIFGRVQLLGPGHACLLCAQLLHPEEVRRDMMSEYERRLDPYLQGAREPAPAVISLNSTIASLAVTMFMAFVTHMPSSGRYLVYNGMKSTLRAARAQARDDCYICSRGGVYGRGDKQELFARQD